MAKPLTCELQVRSADLDAYGHVNHAIYLQYYEQARVEYLEQCGLSFRSLWEQGYLFVIARAEVDYHQGLDLSQRITIPGEIGEMGNSSVIFMQRILLLPGEELISSARFVAVFVDRSTNRPVIVPENFRRIFSG